jgi:hypothetical protein
MSKHDYLFIGRDDHRARAALENAYNLALEHHHAISIPQEEVFELEAADTRKFGPVPGDIVNGHVVGIRPGHPCISASQIQEELRRILPDVDSFVFAVDPHDPASIAALHCEAQRSVPAQYGRPMQPRFTIYDLTEKPAAPQTMPAPMVRSDFKAAGPGLFQRLIAALSVDAHFPTMSGPRFTL